MIVGSVVVVAVVVVVVVVVVDIAAVVCVVGSGYADVDHCIACAFFCVCFFCLCRWSC